MRIKNILKIVSLILCVAFISSCNEEDKPSYPEIKGLGEEISLIAKESVMFELSGGDGKFSAKTTNAQVATVMVKDKMLTVTAGESEGMTEITIQSADKTKVVKVKVVATPEDGVYMGTEQKAVFKNFVKNSKGLWLVEMAGNPYKGKRIFVSTLPNNLEKNQEIQTTIRTFGINGMDSNVTKAMVESVTENIVKLKVGEYSIVISRN